MAAGALGRIHKLTAQKSAEKAARETAERIATEQNQLARQLHEQLQNAGQRRATPTAADPLADVMTPQDLQSAVNDYEELLEFAELHPDGATDLVVGKDADGNPVKRDYSVQEIAAMKAKAGRILRQEVPRKAGWLQEQLQHEQYAKVTLPEMFKEGTPEYMARLQLRQNVPELFSRLPGADQWVGWGLIGREIIASGVPLAEVRAAVAQLAKAKGGPAAAGANGRAKVDPKVAPFLRKHEPLAPGMPGGTRMQPSDTGGGKVRVEKAAERVRESGDEEAEVDYIGALRESQAQKPVLV